MIRTNQFARIALRIARATKHDTGEKVAATFGVPKVLRFFLVTENRQRLRFFEEKGVPTAV